MVRKTSRYCCVCSYLQLECCAELGHETCHCSARDGTGSTHSSDPGDSRSDNSVCNWNIVDKQFQWLAVATGNNIASSTYFLFVNILKRLLVLLLLVWILHTKKRKPDKRAKCDDGWLWHENKSKDIRRHGWINMLHECHSIRPDLCTICSLW